MKDERRPRAFISLGVKILLFALIIATVPMLIVDTILYRQASEIVIANEHAAMINSLSHIGTNVETVLNHVEELSVMLIQDNSVRAWLRTAPEDTAQLARNQLAVEKQLTFSVWNKSYISSILIEGVNGSRAFTGITRQPDTGDDVLEQVDARKGRVIWMYDQARWLNANPSVSTLAMMRNINDLNTGKKLGVLRVDILSGGLGRSFENPVDDPLSVTYMVNRMGEILAAEPETLAGSVLPEALVPLINGEDGTMSVRVDGEDSLAAVYHIPQSDWTLLNTVPTEHVLRNSAALRRTLITSLLVSFALCIASALLFTRAFTAPLRRLTARMQGANVLDPGMIDPPRSNDEVGILVGSFNAMSARLQTLVDETARSRISQREAEFKALQNQINPHALHNNLDTAYWMSQMENAPKTSEVIWTLSQMYRMSVGRTAEIISVAEELTYLDYYRTMYEIRLDDSVDFHFDVQEGAKALGTVRFILQPLVENAIQHAILPKGTGGVIHIRILARDGALAMVVSDDGVGADVDFLNGVLEGSILVAEDACFAIRNVHQRIRMRFGEAYGLIYERNALGGLSAVILQPAIDPTAQAERKE